MTDNRDSFLTAKNILHRSLSFSILVTNGPTYRVKEAMSLNTA